MRGKKQLLLVCNVIAILLLQACTSIPLTKPSELSKSYVITDVKDTALGQQFSQYQHKAEKDTGILLLDKGEESLLFRAALVEKAEKSIDIQTFIWSPDNVGTLAAERLLRAANRGVRIRVIVDDFPLSVKRKYLQHLDAHPNVEIRIYNALADPGASLIKKVGGMLGSWSLKHRRMHNKLVTFDNSVAIIGGRNIADEYYDMNKKYNFRDRDILIVGKTVPEFSSGFDQYWNSEWVYPISREDDLANDLTAEEQRNKYYEVLKAYSQNKENFPERFYESLERHHVLIDDLSSQLIWTDAMVVQDLPGKNEQLGTLKGLGESGKQLAELMEKAQSKILIETPYLVLSKEMLGFFDRAADRNVDIEILTNSLTSTDNIAAFSGYSERRSDLLKKGIKLRELRPDPDIEKTLIYRYKLIENDPHFSLHAKTAVFDRRWVFIGSFNLDPRSTHLNTELGLVIDSPEFAELISKIIEQDMNQKNSWWVELDEKNRLLWSTEINGKTETSNSEPGKSFSKKIKIKFLQILPIESIL